MTRLSSLVPCVLRQPNSKISCRLALRNCSILLENNRAMRALQFFGVCYYFFLAILTSQSWAALTVDQSCQNVPGVGDMTDTINNQLFILSIEMAQNARQTLEEFIYRPQDMTQANRQRVNDLLAVVALPSNNARFRRTVDGLIGKFPQNLSWPRSGTFRAHAERFRCIPKNRQSDCKIKPS